MISAEVLADNTSWKKKLINNKIFFSKILRGFPKKYKFVNKKVIITVLLSNNKKIKKLNKLFRKKNKPTDILSFPIKNKIKNNVFYLGDIIISYDFMNKPSSISVQEFKKKVTKIFIHGFLHLKGFDHSNNFDYEKMNKEESKIYNMVKSKI